MPGFFRVHICVHPCLNDANFVATGGARFSHNDNVRCHQARQNWHHDFSRCSMETFHILDSQLSLQYSDRSSLQLTHAYVCLLSPHVHRYILPIIVPLIFIFWDVNEKHFTYAGFDHFSILISFYQLCWSYVFLFVVWDLLGKELTHICLCVWWQWINKTVAPLVW